MDCIVKYKWLKVINSCMRLKFNNPACAQTWPIFESKKLRVFTLVPHITKTPLYYVVGNDLTSLVAYSYRSVQCKFDHSRSYLFASPNCRSTYPGVSVHLQPYFFSFVPDLFILQRTKQNNNRSISAVLFFFSLLARSRNNTFTQRPNLVYFCFFLSFFSFLAQSHPRLILKEKKKKTVHY